jgi:predicted peptidase
MITRREAVCLLGSASAGALFVPGLNFSIAPHASAANHDSTPLLAPGAPMSPERVALIEAFKKQSEGLENKFEARTHKSDWEMPYRLFRPGTTRKLPLVLYLHGSGGLGNDNLKQLGLGNIFGTRVWLLPENQKRFPCYVVVPQTDRGWARYDLAIDERRIYVTGQSMGGAGTWNVITNRPQFFAAAIICCGSISTDDGTGSIDTPLWNFHGDSDQTVPVFVSRDRMAARRKAGGQPLYTEYAGVDHNVWEWVFTEPALVKWVFSQRRG